VLLKHLFHLGDGEVSRHRKHHIVQVIEIVVALVQQIGGDVGDGLHRSGNVDPHRMLLVQGLQQIELPPPSGVVVVHLDLLADDALLLLHGLGGEIGLLDEIQQVA